jgi:cell division septation protein DedD
VEQKPQQETLPDHPETDPETAPKVGFTVQVGAFSTRANAEELKTRFERESYTSTISTVVSNGKTLHKVWVGEFTTYDRAKRFVAEIKKKYNIDSIVVTR